MTDEQKVQLLPCPFCGSEPIEDRIEPHKHYLSMMPDYPGSWSIECTKCEFRLFDHDSHDNVVKAWNTRQAALSHASATAEECSVVDEKVLARDRLRNCPFCGGGASMVVMEDEDGEFAVVSCDKCGAASRQHYFCGDDARDFAAAAWNGRHAKLSSAIETHDAMDALRYLELFKGPYPFCFNGETYDTKEEADQAINQVIAAKRGG